ncbi:MAG TPA: ABC transporter permease [Bacillales bacterium]|nr:ABC transporter permease [Bacillales bacterium]
MNRWQAVFMNPVLNKEVKLRFRSFKSFLGILFYLFVLAAVALLFIYMETVSVNRYGGFRAGESRMMFMVLSVVQMLLIAFMTPGLTAGAISGERERQTLNILLTTRQSSTAIILSKLFSSLAYLLLIVVASLPVYALVFLYGGVSPGMVISTFGIFVLTMFTFGSFGVMFSTLIRKTIVSMITSYGVALFLLAGSVFLFFFLGELFFDARTVVGPGQQPPVHITPYVLAMINPIVVMLSLFQGGIFFDVGRLSGIDIPLWQGFAASYLGMAVIAMLIAIRRLRPRMKSRTPRKVAQDE